MGAIAMQSGQESGVAPLVPTSQYWKRLSFPLCCQACATRTASVSARGLRQHRYIAVCERARAAVVCAVPRNGVVGSATHADLQFSQTGVYYPYGILLRAGATGGSPTRNVRWQAGLHIWPPNLKAGWGHYGKLRSFRQLLLLLLLL